MSLSNWRYYAQGVLKAYINFEDKAVNFSEKDFSTNRFKSYTDIDNAKTDVGLDKFSIPLKKIHSIKNLFCEAKFIEDKVRINDEYEYMKSDEIHDSVLGKRKIGCIWTQVYGNLDIVICDDEIICFMLTNGMGSEYLIKEGYEMITPYRQWLIGNLSEEGRGVKFFYSYMIEMSDGVKLSTDVFLPADYRINEKLPAIFIRTPYGKKRVEYKESMYANRGYAVVFQDVRGREDSEGEFVAAYYEKRDGNDSLNWIAKQSWSNGDIGTIGGSYGGYVQWAMAASGNKHLKAIVSQVAAASPFRDIDRHNGCYSMSIMSWNIMMSEKKTRLDLYDKNWDEELKKRPLKDIPINITGKSLKLWDEYMKHPHYDEFWEEMSIEQNMDKIDVPALYFSGYHDGDMCGTMELWEMNKKSRRKNQRMFFGPWFHHFNSSRKICSQELGNNALIYNIDILYLQWFDRFLKNIENNVEKQRLQYYIEGKNEWIYCNDWEDNTTEFVLNLGENNMLTDIAPDYSGVIEYIYDPDNATPHLSNDEGKTNVPLDYSKVEERKDIVCFTSNMFDSDIAFTGSSKVELYAATDCRDTDWVVRLTRVDESGASYRIVDEIIRAKYRNSFSEPELLTEDKVEKYEISLPYIGILIKKGEKLRLQIASAKDGDVFPNSNTGNDPAFDTETIIANQKIYYGKDNPSKLFLKKLNKQESIKWIKE